MAELIEQHAGSLRLWIRSRCAAHEDVVQEAFCKLARQEPSPDNPVAWLYRVCRNLAEKQRTSDKRRRRREQQWAQAKVSASNLADDTNLAETLAAVESLEEELREVLVARLWGRLSLEEVGKLCGVSTATAFRRYQAALESLRNRMAPHCEER
ncbi:MAG: RNA polymerase sigma factor [Planctomycetaceae bacterium]